MSQPFPWPHGKRGAVSFTFDDARDSQPTTCLPILDATGVRASFYIMPDGSVMRQLAAWRAAVAAGHEIANHTFSHPCTGNFRWAREKALEDFTLERMAADIDAATAFIAQLLGVRPRTFAYPCGNSFVGRGRDLRSYVPLVAERFLAGRAYLTEPLNDPSFCDLAQLCATGSDGATLGRLTDLMRAAAADGSWVIFVSHDVADAGHQALSPAVLEAACRYAADEANGLWVDTVENIAGHIRQRRS